MTRANNAFPRTENLQPIAVGVGTLAVLTGMMALGFCAIFSSWLWYDDEGYVMRSVLSFVDGHPLYSEVYTQYGPFFFLYRQILHWLTGLPVSHDVNRFIALAEWLLAAAFAGLLIHRLTGSRHVGWLGFVLSFLYLEVVVKEPGHPQQICAVFTMLAPLIATFDGPGPRRRWIFLALGVLSGAMLLTKINVGIYILLAVALSLAMLSGPPILRWLLLGSGGAVAVALPVVLMLPGRRFTSTWIYMVLATSSIAAVVLVAARSRATGRACLRDHGAFLLGVVGVVLAIFAAMAVQGTTWKDILDGVVFRPAHFAAIAVIETSLPLTSLVSASVGLLLVVLAMRMPDGKAGGERGGTGAGRVGWGLWRNAGLVFGTGVLAIVIVGLLLDARTTLDSGVALRGNALLVLAYATPLAWLLLAGATGEMPHHTGRVVLCFTAVLQSLLAYPVFGSQVNLGTLPLLGVALVCASDGLKRAATAAQRGHLIQRAACTIVWVAVLLALFLRSGYQVITYRANLPIDLAGSRYLRFEPDQAKLVQELCVWLGNHADTFYTVSGMNSLYFWMELEPPTHLNSTLWFFFLTEEEQKRTIRALEEYPRVMLVENTELDFFRRMPVDPALGPLGGPLGRYFRDRFQPLTLVGHFKLYTRQDGHVR